VIAWEAYGACVTAFGMKEIRQIYREIDVNRKIQ
jgi:hypothetical protein